MRIWHVRLIDKAGTYHPFKHWLVSVPVDGRRADTQEVVMQEINMVKNRVRKYYDMESEPLEDGNWTLEVEIVEFEHGDKFCAVASL